MRSENSDLAKEDRAQRIVAELERWLQRDVELMKSETLVGLTPSERQEYDRARERLWQLMIELAKLK